LNELDDRIYLALSLEAHRTDSTSCNYAKIEAKVIPSYKKIIDLTNKKVIEINKNESADFQKTCHYFNLWELKQFVNIHFMKGLFQYYNMIIISLFNLY